MDIKTITKLINSVFNAEMEVKGVKRKRKCVSFDPSIVEKEERKSHPKTPLKESPQDSNQMKKKSAKSLPNSMEF